jgi:hypothetical protein
MVGFTPFSGREISKSGDIISYLPVEVTSKIHENGGGIVCD